MVGASAVLLLAACAERSDTASVSFTQPVDGATVAGGLAVEMSADGIAIEAVGEARDGAGHFHVAADDGCTRPGDTVPRDADHVHLGAGQSEGTIYLEPGPHELCLQAGDRTHVALAATDGLTVNVAITDRDQWCAVAVEVDELFTAADTGDEFPTRQITYENARRLLAQLSDAITQLDTEARDDVAEDLDNRSIIASAFVQAEDADDALAALNDRFGPEGVRSDTAGATWILEHCGHDAAG